MSIDDCAAAALEFWPPEEAVIMVAIAGPESGYNVAARGDHYTHFPPAEQEAYRLWSCDGFTAWGYWQINLRWNHHHVTALFGVVDPCAMAFLLSDGRDNARTAYRVWTNQGRGAWSAYNNGAYAAYLDQAREAVERAGRLPFGLRPALPTHVRHLGPAEPPHDPEAAVGHLDPRPPP